MSTTSRPDAGRPLHERAGTHVGVATGVFGVLTVFGLALLPADTPGRQALVLLACACLSVAATAGLGAWHSARRFALAAVSTATAVACLAALSVVSAAEPPATPTANAGQPTSPPVSERAWESGPTTATTAPTGSPASPSPGGAAPSGPVYLADLSPVSGDPEIGSRTVFAKAYPRSLAFATICWTAEVEYNLGGRYRRFLAVIGLDDESPSGFRLEFSVFLDTRRLPGSAHTLQASQPKNLDLSVAGGNRLLLRVASYGTDCHTPEDRVVAVWGDARLS